MEMNDNLSRESHPRLQAGPEGLQSLAVQRRGYEREV